MNQKLAKQINILSIQHQNLNGHWHTLANSLAESFFDKNYKVKIICPTTSPNGNASIEIKNKLDPGIGQTPDHWTIAMIKTFVAEIRETKGFTIMYDGRIPLLMQVLVASRKMKSDSYFYLNLMGGSIRKRKGFLDFRFYIMKYLLSQVKKQNRVQLISESNELSNYFELISGLKTETFPVFPPFSFKDSKLSESFGDLIILEDHKLSDYALDEVQKYLSKADDKVKITLWINKPNSRFLEKKKSNKDQRLALVEGFLEKKEYIEIMTKHLRHIFVYDSSKYLFATSGKLMESISIQRSIAVPKEGTFQALTEKHYFGNFALSSFGSNELVKLLETSPILPEQFLPCSSDESVIQLEKRMLDQIPPNKSISFTNSLICALLLAFTVFYFKINKYRKRKAKSI
jgi:hypothetical protein